MSNNNKKTDVKSKDKLALCNDIAAVFTDRLIFLIDLSVYFFTHIGTQSELKIKEANQILQILLEVVRN